ncbi:hypothetical protein E1286_34240 [Nonomuraea terrae]|uniref:Transcriptional regulator n=1 Tax=Nonomuraea terrae TaxID=2530383 RepID=A0A4R4YBX7_9ACTN|nr:hypothetical protein E1286_34240 [Nonomuraea terrae]
MRTILDRICDKWTLLVVATLDQERLRFGRSLISPALALASWAIDHIADIEAGRTAYETRNG